MAANHTVRDLEERLRDERLVLAAERGRQAARRLDVKPSKADDGQPFPRARGGGR